MALAGLLVLASAADLSADADCIPRDFLALALPGPGDDPVATALSVAYPTLDLVDGEIRFPDGPALALGRDRDLAPRARIADPTIAEQFTDIYPLDFDLEARLTPWFDPGRARNDAFFRAL